MRGATRELAGARAHSGRGSVSNTFVSSASSDVVSSDAMCGPVRCSMRCARRVEASAKRTVGPSEITARLVDWFGPETFRGGSTIVGSSASVPPRTRRFPTLGHHGGVGDDKGGAPEGVPR